MTRSELEAAVAAAIDTESVAGVRWWPGREMAPIAVRRWSSFARRHAPKRVTDEARIADLAEGLQAHFEPGTARTHRTEWRHLASKLATLLGKANPTID